MCSENNPKLLGKWFVCSKSTLSHWKAATSWGKKCSILGFSVLHVGIGKDSGLKEILQGKGKKSFSPQVIIVNVDFFHPVKMRDGTITASDLDFVLIDRYAHIWRCAPLVNSQILRPPTAQRATGFHNSFSLPPLCNLITWAHRQWGTKLSQGSNVAERG